MRQAWQRAFAMRLPDQGMFLRHRANSFSSSIARWQYRAGNGEGAFRPDVEFLLFKLSIVRREKIIA
jgi:hypothetical protein